jgi:hypothetical protein
VQRRSILPRFDIEAGRKCGQVQIRYFLDRRGRRGNGADDNRLQKIRNQSKLGLMSDPAFTSAKTEGAPCGAFDAREKASEKNFCGFSRVTY